MKLNLRKAFESILGFENRAEKQTLPVSIVLLLRNPEFSTLDELRVEAERAFGVSFDNTKESQCSVMEAGIFTLMKFGPHTISFLNYTKRYDADGDFPKDFEESLPQESQRWAWSQHTSWTAVDYVNGGMDLELEYAVLAKLCAEMINDNCSGVYVPRERSLAPNDGSLRGNLTRIAASRALQPI